MSPMRLIILLVAAGAAIGAVFLVRSTQSPSASVAGMLGSTMANAAPAVPTVEILVARQDIPIGKFVTLDDLKWEAWPEKAKTASFVLKTEAGADAPGQLENFIGAVARREVAEGEPIIADRLVKPGQAGFMAALLTPGMRAVSVEIAPETAAGGFILPDDHVDVIVTREIEVETGAGTIQNVRSDIILANIRILAIDSTFVRPGSGSGSGDAGDPSTANGAIEANYATLELSDSDATILAAAQMAGEISLSLRSITELAKRSGATGAGNVYRDGLPQEDLGVRVYRYGAEAARSTIAGR